jgi:hypothetical protein
MRGLRAVAPRARGATRDARFLCAHACEDVRACMVDRARRSRAPARAAASRSACARRSRSSKSTATRPARPSCGASSKRSRWVGRTRELPLERERNGERDFRPKGGGRVEWLFSRNGCAVRPLCARSADSVATGKAAPIVPYGRATPQPHAPRALKRAAPAAIRRGGLPRGNIRLTPVQSPPRAVSPAQPSPAHIHARSRARTCARTDVPRR